MLRGLLIAIGCVSLAGCGASTYEQRLANSRRYFAYVKQLDDNLSKNWQEGPVEGLRVPRQFSPLRAAESSEDGGASAAPTTDLRQPDYMNFVLPGLLGAWRAGISADVNRESATVSGYLYVLSNYEYFTREKTEERRAAVSFNTDLVKGLAQALGLPMPAEKDWGEVRAPAGDGYVPTKTYAQVTLKPKDSILGAPTEITLYLYQNQDIQVALVYALPKDADRKEHLPERIALSLESLRVDPRVPEGGRGGGRSGQERRGSAAF
jgi:hypothetical protein